jgi:hypothetical protein
MSNISPLMDIGCDKVTYSNYCEARLSGIGRHKIGACSQIDSQHLSDPTNPKRKAFAKAFRAIFSNTYIKAVAEAITEAVAKTEVAFDASLQIAKKYFLEF